MLLIDNVEVRPRSTESGILEPQSTRPSWRQDPLLDEAYEEYLARFQAAKAGDGVFPPIRLPDAYVQYVIELAESWGEVDKSTYPVGKDSQDRTTFAHALHRFGREEYVGTVFPMAERNDQVLKVESPEKASDVFQMAFDGRQRSILERSLSRVPFLNSNSRLVEHDTFRPKAIFVVDVLPKVAE